MLVMRIIVYFHDHDDDDDDDNYDYCIIMITMMTMAMIIVAMMKLAMMTWNMIITLDMILIQSYDGSASDTNHAGVSDANLAVAGDTATH